MRLLLAISAVLAITTPCVSAPARVVRPVRDAAWHVFRMVNGTALHVPTTISEYNALGQKGAAQPTHPGGTWLYSYLGSEYDTPDKRFMDGDAMAVDAGVIVQVGGAVHILPGARIEDGIVKSTFTYPFVEVRPDGEVVSKSSATAPGANSGVMGGR